MKKRWWEFRVESSWMAQKDEIGMLTMDSEWRTAQHAEDGGLMTKESQKMDSVFNSPTCNKVHKWWEA